MALIERLTNLISRASFVTIAALSAGSCLILLIALNYIFEVW